MFNRIITPGRAVTAIMVLVITPLILFSFLRSVDQPTSQFLVNMNSMGQEYVNVWIEPDPPIMQGTTIIAQMADLGGTPRRANSIEFRVGQNDIDPSLIQDGTLMPASMGDMSKRGRFSASIDFPEPGSWWVDIVINMGGEQATVRIPVDVAR